MAPDNEPVNEPNVGAAASQRVTSAPPVPNSSFNPVPTQTPAPMAEPSPAAETSVPSMEPTAPAETSTPMAEPSATAETPDAAPVYGQPVTPPANAQSVKSRNKKLLAIVAGVVALVVLGSGYVFAFYIPNKPENIWNSALVNTGKAYDKLSTYATATTAAKGVTLDGSFKLKGPMVADGTFQGKSVGDDGQLTGSVSAGGLKLNLDVRTLKSTGDTPDLYFKVDGVQGLGGLLGGSSPELGTALNGVNNQWFFVDHTLFEQFSQSAGDTQITRADVATFLKTVGVPSKQYLFTANSQKAAIVVQRQVGRETLDGRSVYHYKVAVNKPNLQAYIKAVCAAIKDDKIGKRLVNNSQGNCSDLEKKFADAKPTGTADAWVDTHTKLIHTLRFSNNGDTNNYVDIGQDFQGGSKYPFTIAVHSKSGNTTTLTNLKFTLDTATNELAANGTFETKGTSSANNESGTFAMTIKPNSSSSLKVDKPAGAKTIIELLNSLGFGSLLSGTSASAQPSTTPTVGGSIQAKARDTERQTDLHALQSHIEAYYAANGKYPTLAQMNDATWRATNMKSLDTEALRDPQGTSSTLVAAPTAKAYAFTVASDGSTYTLTATLEAGAPFTLKSL